MKVPFLMKNLYCLMILLILCHIWKLKQQNFQRDKCAIYSSLKRRQSQIMTPSKCYIVFKWKSSLPFIIYTGSILETRNIKMSSLLHVCILVMARSIYADKAILRAISDNTRGVLCLSEQIWKCRYSFISQYLWHRLILYGLVWSPEIRSHQENSS